MLHQYCPGHCFDVVCAVYFFALMRPGALESFRAAAAAASAAAAAAESLREMDEKYKVVLTVCVRHLYNIVDYMLMLSLQNGQVTSTIGTTAVLCATKAQEIEREYHVQENVAQAATTTYHAVKKIEDDYKVTERVSEGIQTAVQSAAKAEEDYQITARVNAAYTDSLQYAIEMEAR